MQKCAVLIFVNEITKNKVESQRCRLFLYLSNILALRLRDLLDHQVLKRQ